MDGSSLAAKPQATSAEVLARGNSVQLYTTAMIKRQAAPAKMGGGAPQCWRQDELAGQHLGCAGTLKPTVPRCTVGVETINTSWWPWAVSNCTWLHAEKFASAGGRRSAHIG